MPKALLTATVLSHIAQFHEPAIHLLKDRGFEVHVAGRDNLTEKNGLELDSPDRIFDIAFERSPFSLMNILAYNQVRGILRREKYDIIHCNTPVAGIITRLAGQRARASGARLIYTAHGFHFFRGAPLVNWLTFFPVERLFAHLTDVLVTINKEDFARASTFHAEAVDYIPGVGVDLQRFRDVGRDPIFRKRLGISQDSTVVLSVGELNDNKNHQTILRALTHLDTPDVYFLICGNGPDRGHLENLAQDLGIEDRVHFLGYRRDIPTILSSVDIFCLPSLREGLPLALMEAMAVGKPVIASNIRGVADLVDPGLGGILVDSASNAEAFGAAIDALAVNPELRRTMGMYNRRRVEDFSIDSVVKALEDVYGFDAPGSR